MDHSRRKPKQRVKDDVRAATLRTFLCPKCGSTEFYAARENSGEFKRRCKGQGCKVIWSPEDDDAHLGPAAEPEPQPA